MGVVWSGKNSKGFQVGIEAIVSYPNATQGTVTARLWIRGGDYDIWDADISTHMYGSHTGSWTTNSYGGQPAKIVGSKAITYNRKYGGAVGGAVGARTERLYGGDVTVTTKWSIPALPYEPPADPISVVASRVSDAQINIGFEAPYTAAAPVAGVWIDRSTDGGVTWRNVATLASGGGRKNWSDTSVTSGGQYQYRVMSYSEDRRSDFTYSGVVYTSPAAPVGVIARRDGTSVIVEWGNSGVGDYKTQIWDNGNLLATVGAGVTSWVHAAPSPSVPHVYVLTHTVAGLVSPESKSNTVTLLSVPLAPTGLNPDGGYVAANESFPISWIHNPTDGTGQKQWQLSYQYDGGGWYTRTGTGNAHTWEISAKQAGIIEWRIRTWGEHATVSPWSNIATVYTVDRPTLTLTPIGDTVVGDTVTLEWATNLEGTYRFEIDLNGALIQATASSRTYQHEITGLENNKTYTVRVRVLDKVWSNWVTQSFTVSFPSPAYGVLTQAGWDADWGFLTLDARFGAGEGYAPTEFMTVEAWRGGVWVKLADVTEPTMVVDYFTYPGTVNRYRTVSHSGADMTATKIHTFEVGAVAGVVLVTGDVSEGAVLKYDVEKSVTVAPSDLALHYMAGRTRPVAFFGVHDSRVVKLSAALLASEANRVVKDLERLMFSRQHVLYRDPEGLRFWAIIDGGVSLTRERKIGSYQLSISLTEVDHAETR